MNKRQVGNYGEERAVWFLTRKGYQILGRNYRCRQGEVDIIAKDGPYLVFIEVKYRKAEGAAIRRRQWAAQSRKGFTRRQGITCAAMGMGRNSPAGSTWLRCMGMGRCGAWRMLLDGKLCRRPGI